MVAQSLNDLEEQSLLRSMLLDFPSGWAGRREEKSHGGHKSKCVRAFSFAHFEVHKYIYIYSFTYSISIYVLSNVYCSMRVQNYIEETVGYRNLNQLSS